MRIFISLLALLATTETAAVQEPAPATSSPAQFVVTLKGGDQFTVTIPQESITIVTKYGPQTIPLSEVLRIDFGMHFPEKAEQKIKEAIRRLGNDIYHDRERASRDLVDLGPFSYQLVKKVVDKEAEVERKNRLSKAIKEIEEKFPARLLNIREKDFIHTPEMVIVGKILCKEFKGYHQRLRTTLSLDLSELSTMVGIAKNQDQTFTIDATRNGSALDQWFNTEIMLRTNTRLVVVADGKIDLWPQGPGQYLAAPKGYNTAGKGGQFMAGALIGRIGENGKAFHLGDRYEGILNEEGPLFLLIVPSPWNNASSGNYQVRITTSHAPK